MVNIFEGFKQLFTSYFNFMNVGTDLIIIAVVSILILATKLQLKDKLLLSTILFAGLSIAGLFATPAGMFITISFGIFAVITNLKD